MRKLLTSRHSPKPSRHSSREWKCSSRGWWSRLYLLLLLKAATPEPTCVDVVEEENSGLDEDTLTRLVEVLGEGDVPWRKLAEKLGMMTLTPYYQDSAVPCQHLLQHYRVWRHLYFEILCCDLPRLN